MGKDDYTSTGGGLKLKGVKGGGIDKHKKKKKKPREPGLDSQNEKGNAGQDLVLELVTPKKEVDGEDEEAESGEAAKIEKQLTTMMEKREAESGSHSVKTEAERRHEEMRRKRVCVDDSL